MNQRLIIYRRIAEARAERELDQIVTDLRDRYGPPPASVHHLEEYGRIRIVADRLGLEAIDREGQVVLFRFRSEAPGGGRVARLDATHLVRVVSARSDVSLAPPATLKLDLRQPARPVQPVRPRGFQPAVRRPRASKPASKSWWTARAIEEEVTPGFSREEILKPPTEDPTAPDGVFTRVGGLLRELASAAVE
jgi:transcription-repair coupling factor (superfamily II helicase)